ncbi:hypothetical protein ACP90_18960 [Labrenzia sp. CP4]|jgi:hypothetical protein|uniref:pentapeptide repeat-containing protein n=1 Tax=Labrenzia sp. CP4 TaxID=1674922 RepID=UPI00078247DD|nr:pentapeptide repeat-containing protein [Labrenzia sp. CP4]AMN54159.1 hypothetical protein ACP90_18960 [Labrenzia sp. CP4]
MKVNRENFGNLFRAVTNFELLGKVLIIIELVAIPLGVYAIYLGYAALQLQVESNDQQLVATAWQQLTTAAPGNSGKSEALMTLAGKGVPLVNLRLDCETMGGQFHVHDTFPELERCKGAPYFSDLTFHSASQALSYSTFDGSDFNGFSIEDNIVFGLSIRKSEIKGMNFVETNVYDLDITESNLEEASFNRDIDGIVAIRTMFQSVEFTDMQIRGADFTNAKFSQVTFKEANASDWNVSGADFCWIHPYVILGDDQKPEDYCATGLSPDHSWNIWAWDDNAPKGLEPLKDFIESVKLCPASLRNDYYKNIAQEYFDFTINRGFTLPKGC